ncbi:hypothetical protein WA556_000741 [Blastocystis sp. ATCC 50177/Nand II]
MESAEVDDVGDAVNLDDKDLVVMDADDFIQRAEDALREENNGMNEDQDSVDDPVEDAALLSECEIKRDSVCSFTGHTDSVLCVAFNQHRPLQFATGGQDDKAFLHQLTEEAPFSVSSRPLVGHQDSVCDVAFSTGGEYLATCDMNGVIKVWDTKTGELVKTLQGPEEPEWLCWHNKNNVLFAAGNDFSVWSWSLPKGLQLPLLCGHTDLISGATMNPSGQLFITVSLDNTMKLWKLKTHELVYSFKADEHNWHEGGVVSVDCHPTTALCVSGGRDGSVCLTNAKTHRVLCRYNHKSDNPDVNCSVEAVRFNKEFNWVVSGSMDGTVIVYDYDVNRVRQELKHNGGVVQMLWHPNNFVLVTGCLDGCIYVWDARNGRNLYTLSGHTDLLLGMDIFVRESMLFIASVSDDKTCQIFRVRV